MTPKITDDEAAVPEIREYGVSFYCFREINKNKIKQSKFRL